MTLPTGVTPSAPSRTGLTVFDQQWLAVAFLHWEVSPTNVEALFPPGTGPDTLNGVTYVGLVAFRMASLGFGRALPLPYLGRFPEINVRLYSVDGEGRHGVVFRSLEATRLLSVLGGRWGYKLPYTWAQMRITQRGSDWTYRSTRRMPMPAVSTRIGLRVGETVEPTIEDTFVTARWGLHSRVAGRTLWTPNEHPPWQLKAATLTDLHDSLVPAAGVPVMGPPTLPVLWSSGVHTTFGLPKLVQE
jgi:uncharacterized protein YqjF (DUF2071 family)